MAHLDKKQLDAGLEHVLSSPGDHGTLRLVVARPAERKRTVVTVAKLDSAVGLVGDNWHQRPSSRTADGSPHPDMQLTLMNARVAALLLASDSGWELAGDQLYVDLDLSLSNLPAGTRLKIGSSVIEVTEQPHTGCKKFIERFGADAQRWVNSSIGRAHCLRGINARVVSNGEIAVGDAIVRQPAATTEAKDQGDQARVFERDAAPASAAEQAGT